MQVEEIVQKIEAIAPLETQESWDCSGWQIYYSKDVKKVLLCLSVTQNIIEQAVEKNFDMIIAHHPLFLIPFEFNKTIPIYSAHTNLDKAEGGTTDTLIKILGFNKAQKIGDFLRLIDLKQEITLDYFINLIKQELDLKTLRVVNNFNRQNIKKIAFCAGSGGDFLAEAQNVADAFVTGDVKYHTGLDSNVIIIDVGHFESEYPVLEEIKKLLGSNIEVAFADEKSPFITY